MKLIRSAFKNILLGKCKLIFAGKIFNNYLHNHHISHFNANSHDSLGLKREKRKATLKNLNISM